MARRGEINDCKPPMTEGNAGLGSGPGPFIIGPTMPQCGRHSPRRSFHCFAAGVCARCEKSSNSAHQELALAEPARRTAGAE